MTADAAAVVGISRLDDHVLLADAGLAMAMVTAGAQRLVDLRGETRPPGLPIPIDHFPIMDLEPGQDELILIAAQHVASLVGSGLERRGVLPGRDFPDLDGGHRAPMLGGMPLALANQTLRAVRPQAMPANELWGSLERIEAQLAAR